MASTSDPEYGERDKEQILLERRANLMSLQNHKGWNELLAEVERRKGRDVRSFVNALISGHEPESLQRQVDYLRGWEAALTWVTSLPGGAESSLERFVTKEKHERA